MADIHLAIQGVESELEGFDEHRDLARLANALRELKVLGVEAMMAGDITASNTIGTLINSLPRQAAGLAPAQEHRFLSVFVQEFQPTLEMVCKIKNPSVLIHHKLVKSLISCNHLSPDSEKLDLCVSMAKHDHYVPLAKLLDALMGFLNAVPLERKGQYVGSFSELMAQVSEVTTWSQKKAKLLIDVFQKHAALLVELISNSEIEDSGDWNIFANAHLLRQLQARDCPELVEALFHRFLMNNQEPDLVDDLLKNGLTLSSEKIEQFLAYSYREKIGMYPYAILQLHLSSGGEVPMLVNFQKFGGWFVGECINTGLHQWSDQYPDVCLNLAHQFLDNDPSGNGLFARPLPRILIERSERLRADNLSADLGL